MKKTYEYFASKQLKNQPSSRKPNADGLKTKELIVSRKEDINLNSNIASVPNSLKNSKN